jgi:hypothetical protein
MGMNEVKNGFFVPHGLLEIVRFAIPKKIWKWILQGTFNVDDDGDDDVNDDDDDDDDDVNDDDDVDVDDVDIGVRCLATIPFTVNIFYLLSSFLPFFIYNSLYTHTRIHAYTHTYTHR